MKTYIRFNADSFDGDYKKGETGYIDGYVFNGTNPLVCVVMEDKVVLTHFNHVTPYNPEA